MNKVLKFLGLIFLSIIFIGFCGVYLLNSSASNTIFNPDYFKRNIPRLEIISEFRDISMKNAAIKTAESYEGDLDKDFVEEIVEIALLDAFSLKWFEETLETFSFDFVQYSTTKVGGLYSTVSLTSGKDRFMTSLSRQINEKMTEENASYEEVILITRNIEEQIKLPNNLVLEEVLEDNLGAVALSNLDYIPRYRDMLIVGLYFGFGLFVVLYYLLGGITKAFRWMGFSIMASGAAYIVLYFNFFRQMLMDSLLDFGVTSIAVEELLSVSMFPIIQIPIVFTAAGLIIFIVGILMGGEKLKPVPEPVKEDVIEVPKVESEKNEVEEENEVKLEENEVESEENENVVTSDEDPFAEKPPTVNEAEETPPEKPFEEESSNENEIVEEDDSKKEVPEDFDINQEIEKFVSAEEKKEQE